MLFITVNVLIKAMSIMSARPLIGAGYPVQAGWYIAHWLYTLLSDVGIANYT